MNDWILQQKKIEEQKNLDEKNENEINNDKNNEEEENNDDDNDNKIDKEGGEFDFSKYNVVSLDNMKNENNNKDDNNNNNENKNKVEEKKDIICVICQRKFNSLEKLALHEKISELHKNNLNKLNSAKNNYN